MVAKFYKRSYSIKYLRKICFIDKEGTSLQGLIYGAQEIGFETKAVELSVFSDSLSLSNAPLPAILYWDGNHFVTLYKIFDDKTFLIGDPKLGKIIIGLEEFESHYFIENKKGVCLLLKDTGHLGYDNNVTLLNRISFIFKDHRPSNRLLVQLVICLVIGVLIQFIFPFLTQSIVDIGIQEKNVKFIYLILMGQLMLFIGQVSSDFIQKWITLHISIRLNVGLVSSFLKKLLILPIGFFDSKNIGDLMQRISDHKRVESFLTRSLLSSLIAILSIFVFGFVLLSYSTKIFTIFVIASALYFIWISFFLRKRKVLDEKYFQLQSDNQNSLIEIIRGVPDIKLYGSENKHRSAWENIQARLFKVEIQKLLISQYQDGGSRAISNIKDIIITVLAATSVINGELTLGGMIAIQYVIGQLNSPLQVLVGFVRLTQDALLSLERMMEVHSEKNEQSNDGQLIKHIPKGDIVIENLCFRYSPLQENVLHDLNFKIERGKKTAIVGYSGSGKTTLLKLLLGFYEPTKGEIRVEDTSLANIDKEVWRKLCGVVLQDSFIFSKSIEENISESDMKPDFLKVVKAASQSNAAEFISTLPKKYQTKIGLKGIGLSQGQKQRILIARSIYKDPQFFFFDEATNSLDAQNESKIMANINHLIQGKTSIIVAHRLSTVKNADKIIVLNQGRIAESGTHDQLLQMKGIYYGLVKEQLEISK